MTNAEEKPYGSASSLSDFKNVKLLGEGAFAAVYKVMRYADGQIYAIKKVKLPSLNDKEKQNALNEIRLLASVKQENIVSYKDAFFDEKTRCLCIVTECCDGGDLMEQINRCQKERTHLAESDIWRWTVGLGRALRALHGVSPPIFHRDMKSANIFLSSTPWGRIAKLGDFNVSTVAKKGLCLTQTGTPYYASPEVWRDMPYDGKSDMWGLGCVIYEAAGLKPPFRAEDMEGLAHKVCVGKYRRIPSVFSNELSDVIGMLLQVNPRNRPSAAQFLLLPLIMKHTNALNLADEEPCETDLLSTIRIPRKFLDFQNCLPQPKYEDFRQADECSVAPSSKADMVTGQSPKLMDRIRKVASAQKMKKCRSEVVLPRKRSSEAERLPPLAEQKSSACLRESPKGPENSLPRIQLQELAPNKGMPKGLKLKLPRISSCRGALG